MNIVAIKGGCLYNTFDSGLTLRKEGVAYQLYNMHIQLMTKI